MPVDPAVRISILSSHTVAPLERHLRAVLMEEGIAADVVSGGFDRYMQELLAPADAAGEEPDVTIVLADRVTVLGDPTELCYALSPAERRATAEDRLSSLCAAIDAYASRMRGKVVVANFPMPTTSPFGHADEKDACGYKALVREANASLEGRFRASRQVIVFDLDGVVRTHGETAMTDPKMEYVAGMKFSDAGFARIAAALRPYARPARRPAKKCAVVDLDGTLWGGVVGEDGVNGISLGPVAPGNAYVAAQRSLLHRYEQGVIIAIASRNNPEDALAVLRGHPAMLLRERHVAAMRLSWDDKTVMLRSLADELGIGLDSMVFIDNDPVQRALVRETLPMVAVLELPEDPARYAEAIDRTDLFARVALTEEDRARGVRYAEEKERREASAVAPSYEDFLRGLDLHVSIGPVTAFLIPRAAQLTLKTNQFTLTTRRYTDEAIGAFLGDGRHRLFAASVRDRFGDNGMTGLAIVETRGAEWHLDTFLLSCRVLGRGVEHALLARILTEASEASVRKVTAEFIPTEKNAPAAGFLAGAGFRMMDDGTGGTRYETDPRSRAHATPDWITML